MSFSLFLACRYLRPKRSFASVIPLITVCGVMLGVAILIIVLAVMTGFGDIWREKILSFKPHIVVQSRCGDIAAPEEICQKISSIPGVTSTSPAVILPAMIRSNRSDPISVSVVGTDPEQAAVFAGVRDKMLYGQFDIEENGVVIGLDLANMLGARIGSKLLCYSPLNLSSRDSLYLPEEMIVRGVFDFGMRDFDAGFVLCSLGMAQDLLGMDGGAQVVQVQVKDPERAREVRSDVMIALGEDWIAETWDKKDQMLFNALRTEKTMMFILLAFIAVVAAFCVTNTLIVITIQKTREIGLMKALGFSGVEIRNVFVLSGLVQCVLGEGLGLGLGVMVLRNMEAIIDSLARFGLEVFPKSIYGLSALPWRIVGSDIAAVLSIVFVFCLVASFLPATLAARLDPVKAIGQE